jgi:hypothetical protein
MEVGLLKENKVLMPQICTTFGTFLDATEHDLQGIACMGQINCSYCRTQKTDKQHHS